MILEAIDRLLPYTTCSGLVDAVPEFPAPVDVAGLANPPESGGSAGVAALKPREAEITKAMPLLDRGAMWALPELALAAAFAARLVQRETPAASALPTLLPRVFELRDLLITNAEGLARAGLFKQADIDRIRAGRGRLDAAQDCVDFAALYRRNAAALRGKTPVNAGQIREAGEIGAQAVKLIKPGSARKASTGASTATADRDRLFSLLVEGHRELRRAAMYRWVDDADRYVPPLLSRALPGRPHKKAGDEGGATGNGG